MAWDGIYFRVLDSTSDKVFAYDSGGSYISGEDFNLTGANDRPARYHVGRHAFPGAGPRLATRSSPTILAGSYVSGEDFDLTGANGRASGHHLGRYAISGCWTATSDKAFAYDSGGHLCLGPGFRPNGRERPTRQGITWDGTVPPGAGHRLDAKVFTYDSGGSYLGPANFDLASANTNPRGITWDGGHLRVVDRDRRQGLRLRFWRAAMSRARIST